MLPSKALSLVQLQLVGPALISLHTGLDAFWDEEGVDLPSWKLAEGYQMAVLHLTGSFNTSWVSHSLHLTGSWVSCAAKQDLQVLCETFAAEAWAAVMAAHEITLTPAQLLGILLPSCACSGKALRMQSAKPSGTVLVVECHAAVVCLPGVASALKSLQRVSIMSQPVQPGRPAAPANCST